MCPYKLQEVSNLEIGLGLGLGLVFCYCDHVCPSTQIYQWRNKKIEDTNILLESSFHFQIYIVTEMLFQILFGISADSQKNSKCFLVAYKTLEKRAFQNSSCRVKF